MSGIFLKHQEFSDALSSQRNFSSRENERSHTPVKPPSFNVLLSLRDWMTRFCSSNATRCGSVSSAARLDVDRDGSSDLRRIVPFVITSRCHFSNVVYYLLLESCLAPASSRYWFLITPNAPDQHQRRRAASAQNTASSPTV